MAIGNGANDELMLREAALSFCLVNAEGAAVSALLAAQVVLHSLPDFFELIFRPGRLVATLRT
jgi:soluble P-type ATPase